ncbi:MAG: hypothetical protein COA79_16700 [Planctomycetota bacterium]|nr:MAG: hypothetical protein COA79_16700 [Planctomycetota bacterium]
MNGDLKIGFVVLVTIVMCFFFVAFTTPRDKSSSSIELTHKLKANNNLTVHKNSQYNLNSDFKDDFSLDYVVLDDNHKISKALSKDQKLEHITENEVVHSYSFKEKLITRISKPQNSLIHYHEKSLNVPEVINHRAIHDIIKEKKVLRVSVDEKKGLKDSKNKDILYTIKESDELSNIAKFYFFFGHYAFVGI